MNRKGKLEIASLFFKYNFFELQFMLFITDNNQYSTINN